MPRRKKRPDLPKDQCCSCTEACQASSNDKNQVIRLKVGDLTHVKGEVDLLHVTCSAVKREHDETDRELQLGPNAEYKHFFDNRETFPLRSTQECHQCSHSTECPHTCGICNKSFSKRSVLETHQEIQNGECSLPCDVCNNSFSALSTWKEHQLSHTGKRAYVCHICQNSFNSLYKLKRHHQHIHTVLTPKVTCTSQGNSCATTSCEDRNVPPGQGMMQSVEEGVRRTYRKWKNGNVALMEEVVTIGQNEEETGVTVCFAADEATHRNHDEVKGPQEVKEPQEVIAPQEVKEDHADFYFLQSLIPDMKKLSNRRKRKFKELMLSSIGQMLDEQEN